MVVKELFARLGLEVDEVAFAKGEAAIGALSKGWMAFGGAVVAGLAVGAAAIAKTTANAADHVRKLAQRTGVDSIMLQEFAHAADLADVSVEQLAHGMQRLAKSGVKDVSGGMLKIAEQFHKLPNDGRRIQFLMEKFGRAGAQLAPMFSGGREELEKLMAEAHDLGIVFTEEDQVAAEEFNDELTRLGKAMLGIRNMIGLALIRPLTKVVVALKNAVVAFRKFTPAAEKAIMVVKGLAFALGGVLLAALLANAGAIALNVTWYAALSIAAVVAAAKAVVAWLAAAAPFIALAAAITLVLMLLEDLYQFITGGESVIGDLDTYVRSAFGTWPEFLKGVLDWMLHLWTEGWRLMYRPVEWLSNKAAAALEGLVMKAKGALTSLPFVGSLLDSSVSARFGGGASPAASVGGSVNTSKAPMLSAPQFNAAITVNASPGMSTKELANQVTSAADDWWNSKMREASAGVP